MNNRLQFPASEYLQRIRGLKRAIAERSIDLILLTDKANFEYFCGYKTFVWISSARPTALLVSSKNDDHAIIIASNLEVLPIKLTEAVPSSVETASYGGFAPEFIETVVGAMKPYNPQRIAIDYGEECFGFGSLKLIEDLKRHFSQAELIEGAACVWQIRCIKSPAEIQQKRAACAVATSSLFEAFKELRIGHTEIEFERLLTVKMIQKGASSVPFLSVKFGRGELPTHLPSRDLALAPDDFIYVDIGCKVNDSVSDLSRVAKAGKKTAEEQAVYHAVRKMTQDILHSFRPGMTTGQAYESYKAICASSALGVPKSFMTWSSRVGHGSGYNCTEPPSICANGEDVLREGMIIHIEPLYKIDGGFYQTEEIGVITATGAEILTDVAPEELPEVAIAPCE
ncbi:M24 family metallopeptidase [Bradyrhizobium genosp. P]|uniref:M24 family metallopeptidase n=1 Tax=Bradyrhizobium genosp. P TaxID=83641 RepID=UPI003CE6D80F